MRDEDGAFCGGARVTHARRHACMVQFISFQKRCTVPIFARDAVSSAYALLVHYLFGRRHDVVFLCHTSFSSFPGVLLSISFEKRFGVFCGAKRFIINGLFLPGCSGWLVGGCQEKNIFLKKMLDIVFEKR